MEIKFAGPKIRVEKNLFVEKFAVRHIHLIKGSCCEKIVGWKNLRDK